MRAARSARRRASKELATYRLRESKGSGLADCSQRRVSWKGFATASDGATIATGDSDGQLVEKVATYGEGGGPLNRADDISEPMEEGSCFGAHAPLRLKDDGLVRHPGFAGREPRSAGVSCGRTSRRSEGGITMSLPQCVDFPNLQVLLSLPRAGSNRTLNPKPDTTITLTERSEQNSPLLIRSPLNLVHHLITPDACSDS